MIKLFVIVIGIAILLLAGCTYLGNCLMTGKPVPTEQKLCTISNDFVVAKIIWPEAEQWSYNLVVGSDTNNFQPEHLCPAFTGHVVVTDSDNTLIEEFNISSTNAQQCNWLINHYNLDGFILNWQQTNVLHSCTPGMQYTINLKFNNRPDNFKSLWLTYLQSQKQKEK
jgi:hypothetical protein